jgi:hypothetical protein
VYVLSELGRAHAEFAVDHPGHVRVMFTPALTDMSTNPPMWPRVTPPSPPCAPTSSGARRRDGAPTPVPATSSPPGPGARHHGAAGAGLAGSTLPPRPTLDGVGVMVATLTHA